MQRHEVWAVWIAGGFLVLPFISIAMFSGLSELYFERHGLAALAEAAFHSAANLLVAAWLFVNARRDGNSPWVWSAAALAFSLMGAVLYFTLRAIERRASGSQTEVAGAA